MADSTLKKLDYQDEQKRLVKQSCLQMAIQVTASGTAASAIVATAQSFYDFVTA